MFYLEKVSFLHKVLNLYSPCQLQWYFKHIEYNSVSYVLFFFCLYSEDIRLKKKKTQNTVVPIWSIFPLILTLNPFFYISGE